jgi:hypothetical protein
MQIPMYNADQPAVPQLLKALVKHHLSVWHTADYIEVPELAEIDGLVQIKLLAYNPWPNGFALFNVFSTNGADIYNTVLSLYGTMAFLQTHYSDWDSAGEQASTEHNGVWEALVAETDPVYDALFNQVADTLVARAMAQPEVAQVAQDWVFGSWFETVKA